MDSGYTKEQLEAMGVNTEHLFVFTEERANDNGSGYSAPASESYTEKSTTKDTTTIYGTKLASLPLSLPKKR